MTAGRFLLQSATAIALAIAPLQAGIIIEMPSVSTATPGQTGAWFDVTLTNNGTGAVNISAFEFTVSVADPGVTFTHITTETATPYIYASDSFQMVLMGTVDIETATTPGQLMIAADVTATPGGWTTLGAGETLGLGRVFFTVAAGESPGTVIPVSILTDDAHTSLATLVGETATSVPIDTFNSGSLTIASSGVPEPATMFPAGLAALALLGAGAFRTASRRKRA